LAVFKSRVEVFDAAGRAIGAGMTYLHLRLDRARAQHATGTVSLRAWTPEGEPPAGLLLEDGRRLPIQVSREVLSECSSNHILRYQADWPPAEPSPPDTPSER